MHSKLYFSKVICWSTLRIWVFQISICVLLIDISKIKLEKVFRISFEFSAIAYHYNQLHCSLWCSFFFPMRVYITYIYILYISYILTYIIYVSIENIYIIYIYIYNIYIYIYIFIYIYIYVILLPSYIASQFLFVSRIESEIHLRGSEVKYHRFRDSDKQTCKKHIN